MRKQIEEAVNLLNKSETMASEADRCAREAEHWAERARKAATEAEKATSDAVKRLALVLDAQKIIDAAKAEPKPVEAAARSLVDVIDGDETYGGCYRVPADQINALRKAVKQGGEA